MSTTYAPSGVKTKIYPYEDFQGIYASRDKGALDTGQNQHLISIVNGTLLFAIIEHINKCIMKYCFILSKLG